MPQADQGEWAIHFLDDVMGSPGEEPHILEGKLRARHGQLLRLSRLLRNAETMGDHRMNGTKSTHGNAEDPDIEAIFERAEQRERRSLEAQRAFEADEQRLRRASNAWEAVRSFQGNAIPEELTGPTLWRRYAELIVDLGRVLKADGWQDRVAAVTPGDDAKNYAIALLRKAIESDTDTVAAMANRLAKTVLHLGLRADSWLKEGLRYEVLGIQPPPEPPGGWEGPYYDAVDSVDDFIRWIDREIIGAEMFSGRQGNEKSSGEMVRNAFRLVMKLEIQNLPLEPRGPFSLNDELGTLRNLRRLMSRASAEADSGVSLTRKGHSDGPTLWVRFPFRPLPLVKGGFSGEEIAAAAARTPVPSHQPTPDDIARIRFFQPRIRVFCADNLSSSYAASAISAGNALWRRCMAALMKAKPRSVTR
jgi:hypothetical protein